MKVDFANSIVAFGSLLGGIFMCDLIFLDLRGTNAVISHIEKEPPAIVKQVKELEERITFLENTLNIQTKKDIENQ